VLPRSMHRYDGGWLSFPRTRTRTNRFIVGNALDTNPGQPEAAQPDRSAASRLVPRILGRRKALG